MKLENAVLNVSNLTRHRERSVLSVEQGESAIFLRFLLVEIAVQLRLGLLIRTYVGACFAEVEGSLQVFQQVR